MSVNLSTCTTIPQALTSVLTDIDHITNGTKASFIMFKADTSELRQYSTSLLMTQKTVLENKYLDIVALHSVGSTPEPLFKTIM
jgi:hypothetical protein